MGQNKKKTNYDDYDDDLLYRMYLSRRYNNFRTGLTFKAVSNILYRIQRDVSNRGEYMFITRHTVLGRWREIKQDMFSMYSDEPMQDRQTMLNYLNGRKNRK